MITTDAPRPFGYCTAFGAALLLITCGCRNTPGPKPGSGTTAGSDVERSGMSQGSEVDEPLDAGAPTPEASSFGGLLEQMGVRYRPATRSLEVGGVVNMEEGLIEVFACAPGGKAHESIIVLDCVPSGVHAGLIALGLEAGTPVEVGTEANYRPPEGPGVIVEVHWIDDVGTERTRRAEDWILDTTTEAPMPHVEWLFTGSFMQSVTGDPADATYAADYVKSIVTTYHDSSTILENPLAKGNDDTVYYAHTDAIPPVGTPVTVVFNAP